MCSKRLTTGRPSPVSQIALQEAVTSSSRFLDWTTSIHLGGTPPWTTPKLEKGPVTAASLRHYLHCYQAIKWMNVAWVCLWGFPIATGQASSRSGRL